VEGDGNTREGGGPGEQLIPHCILWLATVLPIQLEHHNAAEDNHTVAPAPLFVTLVALRGRILHPAWSTACSDVCLTPRNATWSYGLPRRRARRRARSRVHNRADTTFDRSTQRKPRKGVWVRRHDYRAHSFKNFKGLCFETDRVALHSSLQRPDKHYMAWMIRHWHENHGHRHSQSTSVPLSSLSKTTTD